MAQKNKIPALDEITLSCSRAISDADEALDQAHAILVLLGAAFEVDQEADTLHGMASGGPGATKYRQSAFAELDKRLFHDALAGVSTLIAASKHVRAADEARSSASNRED